MPPIESGELPADAGSAGSAKAREWSVPWTGRDAFYVLLLYVGVEVLIVILGSLGRLGWPFLILEALLFGVVTLAWVRLRHRGSVRKLLGERWSGFRWVMVWRGVGLGLAAFAIQIAWFGVLEAIVGLPEDGGLPVGPVVQVGLLVILIADGLLTPISEELFFRGLILQGVRERRGPVKATWISAVAFGVGHFELTWIGNLVSIPAAIFFGWLMARSFEKRGTLLVPILAHITNNLIAASIVASAT